MSVSFNCATLVLTRPALAHADVASLLSTLPSEYHERGSPMDQSGQRWPYGRWSFSSEGHGIHGWLDDHVAWILDQIAPHQEHIQRLINAGTLGTLACYIELTGYNSGATISANLLEQLSVLGLEVQFDFCVV